MVLILSSFSMFQIFHDLIVSFSVQSVEEQHHCRNDPHDSGDRRNGMFHDAEHG